MTSAAMLRRILCNPPAREPPMRRLAPSLAILLACATNTLLWAGGPGLSSSSGYAPPTYSSGYAPSYPSGYAPSYSSGYAPPAAGTGTAGYAPSYAAAYAPPAYTPPVGTTSVAGPAYTSGFSPTASTYVDPTSVTPLSNNGSYQVQRPAYFDNPSVYSGLPNAVAPTTAYQSLRAPLTDSLRGAAGPTATTGYYSAYDGSLPGQPLTVTTPTGTPSTAIPATAIPATAIPATTVTPIYPTAPPKKECCLSRFFRSLCGTNYTTTYYRAPVTYYRPVTSTSPVTGAPVVVQQPCTGYEQQVQRIPSSNLTFGQPPVAPPPTSCPQSCPTTPSGYGLSGPIPSPPTAPPPGIPSQYGTVGQVGASGSTGGVTSIPSIAPPSGTPSYAPNSAPLSGAPTIAPPGTSNDLAPVERPSLNSSPPVLPPPSPPAGNPETTSPTQWQLQNPEDSTALIRPRGTPSPSFENSEVDNPSSPTQRPPSLPPSITDNENFTRAEPIEAPDDYQAPYRRHSFQTPRTTPVTRQQMETSSQPNHRRSYEASDLTSVSSRTPVSRSSSSRSSEGRWIQQPTSTVRDTTWTSVRP